MEAGRMDVLISLSAIVMSAVVIIWVIGVVVALSRWRRHPRVSLFALLAFAVMLVSRFVGVALPPIAHAYGWTEDEIRPIYSLAVALFTTLTSAVAWAFVLCAIFGWRDRLQKQNIPLPPPSTFGNEPGAQNATL
jgi:hypothetical protein